MPTTTINGLSVIEAADLIGQMYGRTNPIVNYSEMADDPRFAVLENQPLYVLDDGPGEPIQSGWFLDSRGDPVSQPASEGPHTWFAAIEAPASLGEAAVTTYSTEAILVFPIGDQFVIEQVFSRGGEDAALMRLWRFVDDGGDTPRAITMAWCYGGALGTTGKLDDPDRPIQRRALDDLFHEAIGHVREANGLTAQQVDDLLAVWRDEFMQTDCTVLDALRFFPDDGELIHERLDYFNPIMVD